MAHDQHRRRRRRRRRRPAALLVVVVVVLIALALTARRAEGRRHVLQQQRRQPGGPSPSRGGHHRRLAFQTPPTPPSQPPSSSKGGPGGNGGSSSSGGGKGGGKGGPSGALPFTSKLLESSSAAGAWTTTAPAPTPTRAAKQPPAAGAGASASSAATATTATATARAAAVAEEEDGFGGLGAATTAVTVPGPGPFRLMYDEATDRFAFQTATIRLTQQQPPPSPPDSTTTSSSSSPPEAPQPPRRVVRLVGSVHIAEPGYYQALEAAVAASDVVLYEMITSERNVFRDTSDPAWPAGKEQLGVELAATPELRRMALAHGLEPQLDNMRFFGRRNWFLSDIPKERLCALQRARGERALDEGEPEALLNSSKENGGKAPNLILARFPFLGEMAQMFWEGFTSRGKVLPKFLPSLRGRGDVSTAPFRLLRLCMWLTPAPELQLMLLDWARQYPPAGGLSKILRSMVGALVHADFLTLRRLAFSQMLTSSQGAPAPEVLVLERNSKVVLDVAQALEAASAASVGGKEGAGGGGAARPVEVAVLYGGLHLKDMEEKLVRHLNFTRDAANPSSSSTDKGTDGALEWTTAWTMPAYTSTRPALVAALCIALPLLYLGVGAADWSATFGGIAHDIALGALHPEEAPPVAVGALTYEAVREAFLYVFRHLAMYYGLSRWVVEWERQLFELK